MGNVLDGKVAVVTGSGQGIGKAIALGLAQEGAKIVTNNRKKGSTGYAIINDEAVNTYSDEHKQYLKEQVAMFSGDAETVAEEIKAKGGEAVPFFGDVTEFDIAGKLIQTAVDSFGKIDILVNVAGAFSFASCWEMSEATWDHVCTSKPKGYFNTIRHAAPHMMKRQWGRVINTSALAFTGMINHCNYSAANAGVIGLTKGVAKELYQYGITCNAYTPHRRHPRLVRSRAHAQGNEQGRRKNPLVGGSGRPLQKFPGSSIHRPPDRLSRLRCSCPHQWINFSYLGRRNRHLERT